MFELNKIYHADCLDLMREIPDKSIDLIINDIPYNIGKDKRWDRWKKQSDYVDYIGERFLECQRVLKDTCSFYFFHNDFLRVIVLQNWISQNTRFIFKQFIVWNKKFKDCENAGFLQGFNEVENLRNYQKFAEYLLFYTFQDETGLTRVMLDTNNFPTLRKYAKGFLNDTCLTKKKIVELVGQRADHFFRWNSSQWDLCTEETYTELLKLPHLNGFKRKEYEELRKEYEELRYTFNNQKTHHSVWEYNIAPKYGHITPKPIDLIANIIKYSSNENDTVLDCFSGSGTTAIACHNLNRQFVCIEKDKDYYEKSVKRYEEHIKQTKLNFNY